MGCPVGTLALRCGEGAPGDGGCLGKQRQSELRDAPYLRPKGINGLCQEALVDNVTFTSIHDAVRCGLCYASISKGQMGVSALQPTGIETGGQLPAGTRLKDIYQIDSLLAKGGMGELYRGHTIESGDAVAIKLIRPDLDDDDAALALFRKEASILSRLNHQAIVRYFVFSFEPTINRHFMAMELVEGESLSALLRRGPLRSTEVKLLGERLASGLQAVHAKGIIHRDVAPDNVIIQDGNIGRARIIDFGIARSGAVDHTTVIGRAFAGKRNYVSPEQVGLYGGKVTEKSDIYSLGLVLVQCLQGQVLDMGGTWFEIIEKRQRIPDLSLVDPSFRPLLERMLEPDPASRLATMTEVINFFTGSDLVAPIRRTARATRFSEIFGRWRWATASFLIVILFILFAATTFHLWLRFGPNSGLLMGTADKIFQYVRNYAGSDCFLALPTNIAANAADIDAFGVDVASLGIFNEAFKKEFNWEPNIYFRKIVSRAQCPVLDFVGRLPPDPNLEPRFAIGKPYLRNGDLLEGSLTTHSRFVALLVVDDEGLVQRVSNYLKPGTDGRTFSIPNLQESTPDKPNQIILVAVTSTAPIDALRFSGAKPSHELFAATLVQAQQRVHSAAATIAVIKMN
jgi:Protein kinase domain